ncbi:MAG TPA: hypothetical protein G4O18_00355 [Dehalococcoidia bacterium]|nr:hypothetical protein [Dehalococcoidia bacterium]
MSVVWGGSDGGARFGERSQIDRFIEHSERMRSFLRYHVNWRAVWTSPIDKMLPYDIRHGLAETGGIFDAIDGSDWELLLPLRRVTRRHIVLN